eukprot:TRINITY_DN7325_c0_g1_i1.p1 TRINITY_DN7325_c0_g1~~TRINITY_DN7325_c0_g1_i1.p1  ORF type:complete len:138 (-),score=18.23 TRINITY_DN7325_c0_g1_i1:77-490(-)
MTEWGSGSSTGRFGGNRDYLNDDHDVLVADQRTKLLRGNAKIDDQSERLVRTHQIALQTEDIGRDVQETLDEQGEKLESARDNVRRMNEDMDAARRIVFAIFRNSITNKIIVFFIILLQIVGIGAIVYLKWIRKLKF